MKLLDVTELIGFTSLPRQGVPACRTNHTKSAAKLHVVMIVKGRGPRSVKLTKEQVGDGKVVRIGPSSPTSPSTGLAPTKSPAATRPAGSIELLFKQLKSNYRLGELPSRKRKVVEALLYATLTTLVVSNALLTLVRRKYRGDADRARRLR